MISVHLQSEDKKSISVAADTACDTAAEASEPVRALKPEAEDTVSQSSVSMGDRGLLHTERSSETTSPPKTPSSVSLAESMQSASHSETSVKNLQYICNVLVIVVVV